MNRAPAFQCYANDQLASFTGLSLAALGAVHRLHLVMWGQSLDQSSFIDDDVLIARTLGASIDEWKQLRQEIQHPAKPVFEEKDGRLVASYLLEERKKQAAWRRKSKQGGKESGKTRALKAEAKRRVVQESLANGSTTGSTKGEPTGQPNTNTPTPSPSSSFPIPDKEKKTHTLPDPEGVSVSFVRSQEPEAERTRAHKKQSAWSAEDAQAASDAVMSAYPKKIGTGDVEAWFRANPVTLNMQRDIVLAIQRQAKTGTWVKDEGRWIPEPIKWLKGKRWKDKGVTVKPKLVY